MSYLRLHSRLTCSEVNGPGRRAVIWVQGCSLGCEGCFNPESHPEQGEESRIVPVVELVDWLRGCDIEGLTISGGEPFQQLSAVVELGVAARAIGLSVIMFTGYTTRQAFSKVSKQTLTAACDVLIAGPYVQTLHLAEGLRGSSNKEYVFLSDCYSPESFNGLDDAEIVIDQFGSVIATGMTVPVFETSIRSRE